MAYRLLAALAAAALLSSPFAHPASCAPKTPAGGRPSTAASREKAVRAKDAKKTAKKDAGEEAKRKRTSPRDDGRAGIRSRATLAGFTHLKFTLPSWRGGRTAWCLFPPAAKKAERVTLVIYCHGMHAIDYARAVVKELPRKATKSLAPVVYLGLVDIPSGRGTWRNRWEEFDAKAGRGPDLAFDLEREARALLAKELPKAKAFDLVFSGFSGGHRVMDAVSRALAAGTGKAGREAKRVKRLIYHDTFYDAACVKYVPALLKKHPHLSIRATVSHAAPRANGAKIAKILGAKEKGGTRSAADGRFRLRAARTHWDAYRKFLTWTLTE